MEYNQALTTRSPVPGNVFGGSSDVGVINLLDDDNEEEVVDLLGDDEVVFLQAIPRQLHNPRTRIRQHHIRPGFPVKDGMCIEIRSKPGDRFKLQYLQVTGLYREHGQVTVRGVLFVRARELGGYFLKRRNEVCKILNIARDDRRDKEEQSTIEISERRVVGPRYLACTNAAFPRHRYDKKAYRDEATAEAKGLLVCRWEYRLVWADNQSRVRGDRPVEYVAAALMAKDASKAKYRVPDDDRRREWRGNDERRRGSDPYTFGDMFCGGGGTSCGARQAGFHVHVACDADDKACKTYDMNFPTTNIFKMDISKFVTEPNYAASLRSQIDVLHLSPPCQPYSPAHTQEGKNDDRNTAALFVCRDIIRSIRPRIFTVEETFGILHRQHAHYLSGLVHGFTELGYSVAWKLEDLRLWGTPCRRRRFIMIGSCPGERLPTFPAHTHTEAGGFVTVAQALNQIQAGRFYDPLHQPRQCLFDIPRPSWNDQQPLSRTLTCGGAQGCYHPSGSRAFTVRELATIQTFPIDYVFASNINATDAKRQIGNAFPPRAAKVLFSHIRKWLADTDKGDGEVVVLDDEDPPIIIIDDDEADEDSDCSSVTLRGDDDCIVVDADMGAGFPANQSQAVRETVRHLDYFGGRFAADRISRRRRQLRRRVPFGVARAR